MIRFIARENLLSKTGRNTFPDRMTLALCGAHSPGAKKKRLEECIEGGVQVHP
jgi:hypothetical protein